MSSSVPLSSMTGYGAASGENSRLRITARLRSVNHRSLDLSIRVPETHREVEGQLRRMLKDRLSRGRVEMTVEIECLEEPALQIEVDAEAIRKLRELADSLSREGPTLSPLSAGDLLRLPGVTSLKRETASWTSEDGAFLDQVVGESIAELLTSRHSEGASLARDLASGLEALHSRVLELEAGREQAIGEMRQRLESRLRKLVESVAVDDSRLLQEVALLVEKSDITEELQRLFAHLEHGGEILSNRRPLGKRFDFLLQELQREINTVGAKCRNLELSKTVLEARALCEQLREQIQNVE